MKSAIFFKHFKSVAMINLVEISSISLTGCASFGPSKSENLAPLVTCQKADVLITNLTVPTSQQQYMLLEGRICPMKEVTTHEYHPT